MVPGPVRGATTARQQTQPTVAGGLDVPTGVGALLWRAGWAQCRGVSGSPARAGGACTQVPLPHWDQGVSGSRSRERPGRAGRASALRLPQTLPCLKPAQDARRPVLPASQGRDREPWSALAGYLCFPEPTPGMEEVGPESGDREQSTAGSQRGRGLRQRRPPPKVARPPPKVARPFRGDRGCEGAAGPGPAGCTCSPCPGPAPRSTGLSWPLV